MSDYLARGFPAVSESPTLGPSRTAVQDRMRRELFAARRSGLRPSLVVLELVNARRVRAAAGETGERAVLAAAVDHVRERLGDAPLIGYAEDARLTVLLPRTPLAELEDAVRHAIEHGRVTPIGPEEGPTFARLGAGLADGARPGKLYVETLIEVAAAGAAVAEAAGGNRCVHTELYALVQDKLERELPAEQKRDPVLEPEPVVAQPTPEPVAAPAVEATPEPPAPDTPDWPGWTSPPVAVPPRIEAPSAAPPENQPPPSVAAALDEEVDARVRALVDPAIAESARAELLRTAREAARREWGRSASTLITEHNREIEQLERRIAKLNAALAAAEGTIDGFRRREHVDPGVASAFRSVQGLSFDEENYELKRELMGMIFQTNLELKRELSA